jgi:hypothetical protein
MAQFYIAVYLVPSKRWPPHPLTGTAAAFYEAALTGEFPYDIGDDPSFFASSYLNVRDTR